MGSRIMIWALAFGLAFVGVMAAVTRGTFDCVALSSVPVVLFSQAIVFGMLYATFYHDGHESAASH